MENEVWKPVVGWEGLYEVSSFGRIMSLGSSFTGKYGQIIHKPAKMRKAFKMPNGYLIVNLWRGGKNKFSSIHRLVALAFIPNPENKLYVNHIDCNKENNRVDNLEWCTQAENTNHAYANNLIRSTKGEPKPHQYKAVIQSDLLGKEIAEYISIQEASRVTGVPEPHITMCAKGRLKTAGKFLWKYKTPLNYKDLNRHLEQILNKTV